MNELFSSLAPSSVSIVDMAGSEAEREVACGKRVRNDCHCDIEGSAKRHELINFPTTHLRSRTEAAPVNVSVDATDKLMHRMALDDP